MEVEILFGPTLVRSSKPRFLTVPAGVEHIDEATLTPEEFRDKHQIKISGVDPSDPKFSPVASFDTCGFDRRVVKILDKLGFLAPTSTQSQSWPVALEGRDLISVAKTGSGKTLGFLAPAFSKLVQKPKKTRHPKILVLAPTRELCLQIHKEAANFELIGIRSVACYGGASRFTQMNQIRRGADAIIATPGRCNDFLEAGTLNVSEIDYVVLDEADRMLDMGFEPQIREILNDIPASKQLLLFTATWPKEVVRLAKSYVKEDAVHINIGDDGLNANKAITQNFIMLDKPRGGAKMQALTDLMQEMRKDETKPASVPKTILFCSRKSDCDFMVEDLQREGYSCAALHGDKSQNARDTIMDMFRKGRTRVLVATDVASRGLDVRDVEAVINYDFPPSGVEDYIHRIGRTARGDRTGVAYTFLTSADEQHAQDLVEVLMKSEQQIPDELLRIVESKRRPMPKKQKFGSSRGAPGGSRYGKQRDGGFQRREGGFQRGDGNQRREGGFQRREGGFGDRNEYREKRTYGEDRESRHGGRDDYNGGRGGRGDKGGYRQRGGRDDVADADDLFNERKSLRGWSR